MSDLVLDRAVCATGDPLGRVVVVLPGDVDDPARPSGGNRYDRRTCEELRALGWLLEERAVHGTWPYPHPATRKALVEALTLHPREREGTSVVLIDGLVAAGAPDVVTVAARTRPVVGLLHMPFGPVLASLAAAERLMLTAVAAVVTPSEWARRFLVDSYQLDPSRIHVVSPGVDRPCCAGQSARSGATERTEMLCVAAVTKAKGLDVLVTALAELARSALGQGSAPGAWRCTCAGSLKIEPEFAADVRERVRAAGLCGQVRFTGALDTDTLATAYASADLLVLPSVTETWGMVVSEALSWGIPVVASDVGGIREALGQAPGGIRPGLLVRPGDPRQLAGALRRWLGDPALRERLRSAARARRPDLSGWDRTARLLSAVLTSVLAERVSCDSSR